MEQIIKELEEQIELLNLEKAGMSMKAEDNGESDKKIKDLTSQLENKNKEVQDLLNQVNELNETTSTKNIMKNYPLLIFFLIIVFFCFGLYTR